MADMFRTPWGTTVWRGPELIKALRARYTEDYFAQRINEDETPFVLYGREYGAGDTFRAVDPEGFKQSYEVELETVTSGEYDDVLDDIFGFQRVRGSKNIAPRGASNRRPSSKKAPARKPANRRR